MRLFKLSLPRAAGRIDELRGSVRSGQSLGKTLNRFPARIRRAADCHRFKPDAPHAAAAWMDPNQTTNRLLMKYAG